MASYDYFKQYVSEMENQKAKTVHEEHIVEFRALCAKMINDAIPEIKRQAKEEILREQEAERKSQPKQQEVEVKVSAEKIRKTIYDAIKRAFK